MAVAGLLHEQRAVQVLRDGFPSYVMRVRPASPHRPAVVVKVCPDGSLDRTQAEALPGALRGLARRTLAALALASPLTSEIPPTLVHGDYHDGNILIRPTQGGEEAGQLVIVDWDSAGLDSGFFDLVSLCDVAGRMGTFRPDRTRIMEAYLRERCAGGTRPRDDVVEMEWRRCCLLRAWGELRWFSETGEDFGDRVGREVGIITCSLH